MTNEPRNLSSAEKLMEITKDLSIMSAFMVEMALINPVGHCPPDPCRVPLEKPAIEQPKPPEMGLDR